MFVIGKSVKILIINTLYTPNHVGGAEISVQMLAEELVKKGHTVRVLCISPEKNRTSALVNKVEVVYIPLANIYWPFDNVRKNIFKKMLWHLIDTYNPVMKKHVNKELKEFNPQIVHTNNIGGFSVSAWKAIKQCNKNIVHTTRDYYLFHPNSTLFKNESSMNVNSYPVTAWSFFRRYMSNLVDIPVGISRYISEFHENNGFFKKRIVSKSYIYNPVDAVIPNSNLQINSNQRRIGFIGRMTKEKGFDLFCDVADAVIKDSLNFSFVAAGRFGTDSDSINLKARAISANIEMLGFVPLKDFLSKVDIVLLPIKWMEPFGRSVVESVLSKKIVITNSVGGLEELSGLLPNIYCLDNKEDIIEFLKSDLIEYKTVISEEQKNIFSQDTIASNYERLYKLAIEKNA